MRFKRELHKVTDYYLIRNVKVNEDEECLHELNLRYQKFCFKQMHKYKKYVEKNGTKKEDLFSSKFFIIYDAAKTFKKEKNIKFITWLGSKIRFFCLNIVNATTKKKLKLEYKEYAKDLDLLLNEARNLTVSRDRLLDQEKVFSILNKSSDLRISRVFKLRYFEKDDKNLAWRSLGKEMDLSSQTVINLHKKGIKLIKQKIKSSL